MIFVIYKFTQFDPFPVANQDDVMNKLASFELIGVFDARAGYWQTPVKPENQWLLGFATHHGLWHNGSVPEHHLELKTAAPNGVLVHCHRPWCVANPNSH